MSKSRVIIRSVRDKDIKEVVLELLEFCAWRSLIKADSKVVIKPNLCTYVTKYIPACNTDRSLIEAVCYHLKSVSKKVTIVESDGPRYGVETNFARSGIYEIAKKYNVEVKNLSKDEKRALDHPLLAKFPLPVTVLDADIFIDLPVLKTHPITLFTGAIKNLWGCVPQYDRILLHKHLDELLADLLMIIKPKIAIMDAIIAMEGQGPVRGSPRRLDLLLASTDMVAIDATAMRLVGLNPCQARHIVLAAERGYGEIKEENIEIDGDFEKYKTQFQPPIYDWALRATNYLTRYRFFTHYILLNDFIFYPVRELVRLLRKIGLVR